MVKKLNLEQKLSRRVGELTLFLQRYARTAQPGIGPNDRRYDRAVEQRVKQMSPEELDRLLRDDD